MPHIVVLDDLSPSGIEQLKQVDGITFEIQTGLKGEGLAAALRNADGAICRSGVRITSDVLAGNDRLRAIVRAGVGTDNIDKEAATRQGIIVMNTPAGNTVSTAEHTLAMMLAMARNIPPAHATLCAGKWDRKSFSGTELRGKTIGIVGMGRIGKAVADRCRAFEMRVIGFDPFVPDGRGGEMGIEMVRTIAELLPQSDFLTVHTPLTPETENLINESNLGCLRPGIRLVNCARGGIFNEEALVSGLKSGVIAGLALDVFASEPCTESPLFGMPGVVVTPHLGASTDEAQEQVALEAVSLLSRFLLTGEICHAVNATPVDARTLKRLKGQLDLAFRLGLFACQWHGSAIDQCRLKFEGEVAAEDTRLLVSAFCAGLLHSVSEGVNFINAEMACRERGIELVRESSNEHGAFSSLISATIRGGESERRVSGTLFGKSMPRIVRLNQYELDAWMDGNLIVFSHDDVPGIIGFVGDKLASHSINIGQMVVGRDKTSGLGTAIGIMNVDTVPDPVELAELTANSAIRTVQLIRLPTASANSVFPGLG